MHPDATERVPSSTLEEACARGPYDAIVVGAGIAGSALAASWGRRGRSVLVVERDLQPPDRIVGELLQPGGCLALKELGLSECLDDIEAVEVRGYKVFWGGSQVAIPYPPERADRRMTWTDGSLWGGRTEDDRLQEGRSFHHGRFVQRLRWQAKRSPGVVVLEASAGELLRCQATDAVIGIKATPKGSASATEFYAPICFVADGCFSKFRRELSSERAAPIVRSNFVGIVLDTPDPHVDLPAPGHGHVILRKSEPQAQQNGVGPVLVYQIGRNDTRMLIDVPGPRIPSAANGQLKEYLQTQVGPILPPGLAQPFAEALESTRPDQRPRSMPNSYLPAHAQGRDAEGVIVLGDAMNMRHPLTGGGMTVALNDVLILTRLLADSPRPSDDWTDVSRKLQTWYWRRKGVSTCVNVLAQALYSLFGADDPNLEVLKTGCFKYFELGGTRVSGPVSLLSALTPSTLLLLYHFFSVAIYSIYVMFAEQARLYSWPALVPRGVKVFSTACTVILPVLFANMF